MNENKSRPEDLVPTILEMEASGFYHFPYAINSGYAAVILDPSIDFTRFCNDSRNRFVDEFEGEAFEYSLGEKLQIYEGLVAKRAELSGAISWWRHADEFRAALSMGLGRSLKTNTVLSWSGRLL
jgi:hypothetical protein